MSTVGSIVKDFVSLSGLSAAAISALAASLFSEADLSVDEFLERLLTMGGPTALGAGVAALVQPEVDKLLGLKESNTTERLIDGAIGGAVATGILMLAGGLPRELSGEAVLTFAISGGSIFIGREIGSMFVDKKSK